MALPLGILLRSFTLSNAFFAVLAVVVMVRGLRNIARRVSHCYVTSGSAISYNRLSCRNKGATDRVIIQVFPMLLTGSSITVKT